MSVGDHFETNGKDFRDFIFLGGGGGSQRTLTLLQKYRDTNGRRIVIQIGGVYTTFFQEEGILLQKYRDRNGRCIAMLFRSIGVRGQLDSTALGRGPKFRARKRHINFEHINFLKVGTTLGQPAG